MFEYIMNQTSVLSLHHHVYTLDQFQCLNKQLLEWIGGDLKSLTWCLKTILMYWFNPFSSILSMCWWRHQKSLTWRIKTVLRLNSCWSIQSMWFFMHTLVVLLFSPMFTLMKFMIDTHCHVKIIFVYVVSISIFCWEC